MIAKKNLRQYNKKTLSKIFIWEMRQISSSSPISNSTKNEYNTIRYNCKYVVWTSFWWLALNSIVFWSRQNQYNFSCCRICCKKLHNSKRQIVATSTIDIMKVTRTMFFTFQFRLHFRTLSSTNHGHSRSLGFSSVLTFIWNSSIFATPQRRSVLLGHSPGCHVCCHIQNMWVWMSILRVSWCFFLFH